MVSLMNLLKNMELKSTIPRFKEIKAIQFIWVVFFMLKFR